MGWFSSWFTDNWFETASGTGVTCTTGMLLMGAALLPVTVRADRRVSILPEALQVGLTAPAPGMRTGTGLTLPNHDLTVTLREPSVNVSARQDVLAAPAVLLYQVFNQAPNVCTGCRVATAALGLTGTTLPATGRTQTRLETDVLQAFWTLPHRGLSVIIEI